MDHTVTLTSERALQLISPFFDREWSSTDIQQVQVRRIIGGFMNTLHLITRTNAARQEPNSILIRQFGTDGTVQDPPGNTHTLNAAEQAIVYFEMARRGWGPKIYGLFKGGRLEEYIDAHPLTAAEAGDPTVRRDLARSYARLHSLELPLEKGNFPRQVEELKGKIAEKDEVIQSVLKTKDPATPALAVIIRDVDWARELDLVSENFQKHHCQTTVVMLDTNFLNVLVKNFDSDSRVMLIDYETIMYSYRGIDIGGHFNERMYVWSQPHNKFSGFPAPDIEEQLLFCQEYLQEAQLLDKVGMRDCTVEQLLLEAQIGRMYHILFSLVLCVSYDADPEENVGQPEALVHMMEIYWALKEDLLRTHA